MSESEAEEACPGRADAGPHFMVRAELDTEAAYIELRVCMHCGKQELRTLSAGQYSEWEKVF